METTRNQLPYKLKQFLDKLKNDLDTQFYYYGSIQRNDYISGKSDIDICIFTDNTSSIITKMVHFLRVQKSDFKRFIKKTKTDVFYGHKIKYTTTELNSKNEPYICEFVIYDKKFKCGLMEFYHKINNVPAFILFLLFILKQMFYIFPIISKTKYKKIKNYIFNNIYFKMDSQSFFLLD